MSHDVSPGASAFPFAFHFRLVGVVSSPSAIPDRFRPPAQVALNAPFAVVAVCSLTVHLKLLHALGDGMRLPDVHVPMKALCPAVAGPVMLLLCSKPKQPDAASAEIAARAKRVGFLIILFIGQNPDRLWARGRQLECKKYSSRKP